MTARRGPAPDAYVTRTLQRIARAHPEVHQADLARVLGCDRTRIAHQLAGRQSIPADELEAWCDVFDTLEPLEAIADRLGHHVVPKEREASPLTLERGCWHLLAEVSAFGARLSRALGDGVIDAAERAELRAALVSARTALDGMLARMPEAR